MKVKACYRRRPRGSLGPNLEGNEAKNSEEARSKTVRSSRRLLPIITLSPLINAALMKERFEDDWNSEVYRRQRKGYLSDLDDWAFEA